MKVWVTKYALTSGIEERDAEPSSDHPNMISWATGGWRSYAHGKDWHKTREAAIERAEIMRKAKIASLRKSLANFEKLKFT